MSTWPISCAGPQATSELEGHRAHVQSNPPAMNSKKKRGTATDAGRNAAMSHPCENVEKKACPSAPPRELTSQPQPDDQCTTPHQESDGEVDPSNSDGKKHLAC